MARMNYNQTNFTSGEISPRLLGRTEIDKYGASAREIVNANVVIQGGVARRAGTFFSQAAKHANKECRFIPFVMNRTTAFMLEVGDLYIRVFQPSGVYTSVEIVSPFAEAQLPDIDYTQTNDTMYLTHPAVSPRRLKYYGGTSWELSSIPFVQEPCDEQGHYLTANLTLSATSGAGVTVTASAGVFLPSDVGRNLINATGAGVGTIVGYTSTTVVTISTLVTFVSTTVNSPNWYLDVSPQAFIRPSAKEPTGAAITLSGSVTRAATVTLSAKTGAITLTASGGVFVAGDVGKTFYADSGIVTISGFTSSTVVNGTTSSDFAATVYPTGSWGITENTFRTPDDVGKFVRVNGGLCKITSCSATVANANIVAAMTGLVAAPPLSWTLEGPVWSSTNGYPRTCTLHEQRLWFAGSTKYPQTLWASRTGSYLDFTRAYLETDGLQYTINSDDTNPILYLEPSRVLLVHTFAGEFTFQGSPGKPITPTSVQVRPESSYGVAGVKPINIGPNSAFVQRAGRKIRSMGYEFTSDGYKSNDMTAYAEHVSETGITSMCWQSEPDQYLWATRTDGTLVSATVDTGQGVLAWSRHFTDGAFEWIESIPNGSYDQLWAVVRRYVNGATVRYIEWFDSEFAPIYPTGSTPASSFPPYTETAIYGCTVDSGKTYDNGAGQSLFTGLSHLEAKSVEVVADGIAMGAFTVSGGNVTLPRTSKRTLIGLAFVPRVRLLTPEPASVNDSAQGKSMRSSRLQLRLLDTWGCEVVDAEGRKQEVPFFTTGAGVLDQVTPLYTGLKYVDVAGWNSGESEFDIRQPEPLPWHLLSVVREHQVN